MQPPRLLDCWGVPSLVTACCWRPQVMWWVTTWGSCVLSLTLEPKTVSAGPSSFWVLVQVFWLSSGPPLPPGLTL